MIDSKLKRNLIEAYIDTKGLEDAYTTGIGLLVDKVFELGQSEQSAHLIKTLKSELSTEMNTSREFHEGYNDAIQDIITLIEQIK